MVHDNLALTELAGCEGDLPSVSVLAPARQAVPFVFASPHSGSVYSAEFLAASALDLTALRRSEDAFIDEIFASALDVGAPLVKALFPRAYVDPNREAYELDPSMFSGPLPAYVNTASPRVAAGLGTIARVVTSGEDIYRRKLSFGEVRARIERHYVPYHAALQNLLRETVDRFGVCILIDCHSMPSVGGPMDCDPGRKRVDFVLGDRFATSCAQMVTDTAEQALKDLGYSVKRNVPYAGGFTTLNYGRPDAGVHALQIEVNRALYMDEGTIAPLPGLARVKAHIAQVLSRLVAIDVARLANR